MHLTFLAGLYEMQRAVEVLVVFFPIHIPVTQLRVFGQTGLGSILNEQSDQGLHCLPFLLHLFSVLLHCKTTILVIEYSSVFRERCPPPPKPVYGGNFSHEAVTLKIR